MVFGRKKVVETFEFDEATIPTVDSVEEAKALADAIRGNAIKTKAKRDVANGMVEGFVVTFLRNSTKGNLAKDIQTVTNAVGPNFKALHRGLARVKKFRGKNPAWKNVKIAG